MKLDYAIDAGIIVIVILGVFGYITPLEQEQIVVLQNDSDDNLPCSFYGTCGGLNWRADGTKMFIVGTQLKCDTDSDGTICKTENTITRIGLRLNDTETVGWIGGK